MNLVFLLEERSMKYYLDGLLPRVLPDGIDFQTIPFEGKSDLKKGIKKKIMAWNSSDVKFVVVHDQDANDCVALKQELVDICKETGRDVLVRIVCHELEAWYWGDLSTVESSYGLDLDKIKRKSKYRVPDAIISPKRELRKYVPGLQQISAAKRISAYTDVEKNTSTSFQVFIKGVKELCRESV